MSVRVDDLLEAIRRDLVGRSLIDYSFPKE
jgi:hypothetical protein